MSKTPAPPTSPARMREGRAIVALLHEGRIADAVRMADPPVTSRRWVLKVVKRK